MDTDRLTEIRKRAEKLSKKVFSHKASVKDVMLLTRLTLEDTQIVCGGISFEMLMEYVNYGLVNGIIPNVAGLTLTSYK